jgi:hypothetical protein
MTTQEFCFWLDKYFDNEGKNIDEIAKMFAKVHLYDAPVKRQTPPFSGPANQRLHRWGGFH